MKRRIAVFIAVLCMTMTAVSVYAENRVLIITIGPAYEYQGLSGPEKDQMLAKEIAKEMGFQESQIKVIEEKQATRSAILDGFSWVKEGVKGGGKAFIYYSGHGYQIPDTNGDEDDGCDEVLVPVDATSSSDNFIIDDEIEQYLKDMAQAEVVVMIDSCFSGTITKSVYGGSQQQIKFLNKGVPRCGKPINSKSIRVTGDHRSQKSLVVLSATAQNESAYPDLTKSGKGSVFTEAVIETIREGKRPLTYKMLRDEAASRVRTVSETYGCKPHTPQLDGGPDAAFDKDIRLTGGSAGYSGGVDNAGNSRELIDRIVNSSKFLVVIKSSQKSFKLSSPISFSVVSSKDGYLNLIELDPAGNLNVIFPNDYASENKVQADSEIQIPKDIGGFKFEALEPAGVSTVAAIVSREPLNLFKEKSLGDKIGIFKSIQLTEFSALKATIQRSVGVKPTGQEDKEFGAAKLQIEVIK